MKKIKQKIFPLVLLFIILISTCSNTILAVTKLTEAYIQKIGEADHHLKYYQDSKGKYTYVICSIVGHYNNGKFYPAYCMNKELSGVGEAGSYDVDIKEILGNDQIWRAVKNGYPYKSASELGLTSDYDAFTVTKMAIYCLLGQSDINLFSADEDDEEGKKMLEILKHLVNIGRNGKETQKTSLKIQKEGNLKEEDKYYTFQYKVTSSVSLKKYQIKEIYSMPEGTIITDVNNNIKKEFSGTEKFKVKIPKEKFINDISGKISIKAESKTYPIFYGKTRIEGTQDYIVTGDTYGYKEAEIDVNIKTNTGKIKIYKKDSENKKPVEGVKFALLDSKLNIIEEVKTDSNGEACFENLYPGSYILKEIETNKMYEINNQDFKINVEHNKTSNIDIENNHTKGSLKIYKVDKDNNNIALGNIGFDLYSDEFKKIIGTYYTNENGEINIEKIRTGTYSLIEKQTNKWYNITKIDKIEIKKDETTTITVENELKKGSIQIEKVDSENNKIKIPNVKFEVIDKNGKVLEEIITNEEGKAYTSKYPIRDYKSLYIKEKETDEKYILDNEIYEITLEENKVSNLVISNEKKKGKIKVVKVDKDNSEILLQGVEFNIKDSKGEVVQSIVTNDKGEAESNELPIGDYFVEETKTKENYKLQNELYQVKIEYNNTTNLKIENEKKKGKIKIIKVDKENKEILLQGVEFVVKNSRGEEIQRLTTNKNGEAETIELPIDEIYTVQETKTLEEYIISEGIQKIELKEDEITNVKFENEKKKGKIRILKTSKDDNKITNEKARTKLKDVSFEIYDVNKNFIEKITTNNDGIAISSLLPKGKYKIKEIETNKWYILDENISDVEIKENGEIVEVKLENQSKNPEIEIEKTGPEKLSPNEEFKYEFKIKNLSNVILDNLYFIDKIPTEYIKVTKFETGTFNKDCKYNIYYKTNITTDYKLLMEDLSSKENTQVDFIKELSDNEYITEIKLEFKKVDIGFEEENKPKIYAKVNSKAKSEDEFVNIAYLEGEYDGYKITKESKWKTLIYKILPLTGM